jgi:SAM-dependent methyltransferase
MKKIFRKVAALFRKKGEPRNTDRDWSEIGANEPYFGVITHDRFKRDVLDAVAIEDFFASGQHDIDHQIRRMRSFYPDFEPRSALDFGCGVGRLTRPLAALTGDAVGVDISPGMLAEARIRPFQGATFVETIPDRRFGWVVSLIVLQHVPPQRGYDIIGSLLRAVASDGAITLQVTYGRTAFHERSAGARLVIDDHGIRSALGIKDEALVAKGTMIMYDYDLSQIIGLFYREGLREIHLEHTDHGGIIGVTFYARRPT